MSALRSKGSVPGPSSSAASSTSGASGSSQRNNSGISSGMTSHDSSGLADGGDGTRATSSESSTGVLGKRKVTQLLQQVAPGVELDDEVFDLLLQVADDFIETTTTFASQLALHRKSDTLDEADLKLHLEKNMGIRVPGFGASVARSFKRPTATVHRDRLALVKRTTAAQASSLGRK